jgi:hypothetical protein
MWCCVARLGYVAVALAASIVSPHGGLGLAWADDNTDLSRARAKFQQGTELEQAGNFASALQVYRDVGQVRMTPQVRFHIAVCEENLGRLVAALGGFELALEGAESVGPEFQSELQQRIDALRPRIPKLVIERGAGAEAATIELDSVRLGANSIGVEVPLDPGPHSILARAPGHKQYLSTIEVTEQQTKKITVVLEELVREPDVDSPQPASPVPVAPPPGSPRSRLVPYVVGGVGAAALLNAGVFYLMHRSKDSELQNLCGSDHDCTNAYPRPLVGDEVSRSRDLNDKSHLYTTVSGVSAIAGLLALGVAGVWVITAPKEPKSITAWVIQPSAPGAELGGMSVASAF